MMFCFVPSTIGAIYVWPNPLSTTKPVVLPVANNSIVTYDANPTTSKLNYSNKVYINFFLAFSFTFIESNIKIGGI